MARLALAGGTPVRSRPFPRWPDFDERERTLLLEALEAREWGGYPFPNALADRFASAFATAHDVGHAFAVASGTVAIEIALKAAGLRPGDEVILPAYTFEASAAPVLRLEGVPVFVDVLPTTWCLDPAAVEAAITERTRAILPVHLAMCMADMDAFASLARKHDLLIIEGLSPIERDARQTTAAIYHYVFRYDAEAFGGASRDRFVAALEAEGVPCDGLFYEPVYRSTLFAVAPGDFAALGGRLPWAGTRCPVTERAAYEESVWIHHRVLLGSEDDLDDVGEAISKIRGAVDELRSAEHPLVHIKSMSRADRDRATSA